MNSLLVAESLMAHSPHVSRYAAGSFPVSLSPSIDDLEGVSLPRPPPRRAQQRAQRAGRAPLPSDDLAYFVFGDFQLDHVAIELLDENLAGGIDQRFRNQLNESSHISSRLGHKFAFTMESEVAIEEQPPDLSRRN